MEIIVKENYQEMSLYAAGMVADLIRRKPDCVIGFATGRTPVGTYQELIRLHKAGLDFSGIRAFNLDEYLGIGRDMSKPYDQDQSYARFMYEELFRHINVKEENIHIPDGLAKDPDAFCAAYEQEISKAGGIDLQILGIGGDGHWGFNEPGASLSSRTRVENLTAQTLDDNYEAFIARPGFPRTDADSGHYNGYRHNIGSQKPDHDRQRQQKGRHHRQSVARTGHKRGDGLGHPALHRKSCRGP